MKKNKFLGLATLVIGFAANTIAAELPTNTAQMQAMDKITGKVSLIDVPVNSEVKFGSFSILVRDCKTRSPEETPENFAFVDVIDNTRGEKINIFKGWMVSSSPALNAVEHPVYDVWLLRCINTDISKITMMSVEELIARDNIKMSRLADQSDVVSNNGFDSNQNISGEPIDLIPANITDEAIEERAQEEVIKLEAPITIEENEVGTPQSLLTTQETAPSVSVTEPDVTEQEAVSPVTQPTELVPTAEVDTLEVVSEQAIIAPASDEVAPPVATVSDTTLTPTPSQAETQNNVPAPIVPDPAPSTTTQPIVEPSEQNIMETGFVEESDVISDLEKELTIEALKN